MRINDLDGNVLRIETDGAVPVALQDQTSPAVFVKANIVEGTTTLTSATAIGDRTIAVASVTNIDVGDYLGIFSIDTNRYYAGIVTAINALVLTMDNPLDSVFAIGDTVGFGITDMAVDGSSTIQVYALRGADPGIDLTIDVTKIIISCVTSSAVDLSKFGDQAALTNGLLLRRVDGNYQNILGWKTNAELAGSMDYWTVHESTNPAQGQDGFVSGLSFAGQGNVGVALRVGPNENLEFVVQDNLSGITTLEAMFEGHVVVP